MSWFSIFLFLFVFVGGAFAYGWIEHKIARRYLPPARQRTAVRRASRRGPLSRCADPEMWARIATGGSVKWW